VSDEGNGEQIGRWRLLLGVLRDQRRGLAVATVVGLAWTAAKVAIPQLTRLAIDRGIEHDGGLLVWVLIMIGVGCCIGVLTGYRRYLAFREARWSETRLRERLFDHVMSLHIGYHDRAQTGQLMSRASSDLTLLQMFVVMVPITVANLAMMVAAAVILVSTDALLAVIALLPLPLVILTSMRFSQQIYQVLIDIQAEQALLATVVEESVSGVRVVKGFGAEPRMIARVEAKSDDIKAASLRAAQTRARFLPLVEGLPQLGIIAVLGIGGHRAISGNLTVGQIVAFTTYIALLISPLRMTGMTVAWGQRAGVALGRIDEVLSTAPIVRDARSPRRLPERREGEPVGRVELDAVRFGYDPERPVLDGLDLDVPAGGSVALVGGTGSGKSTIARLLVRFYEPQAGSIRLDGVPVDELTLHDLRRSIGIVFEDTLLFHDTVAANIAFADPDADADRITRAAQLAGAHEFIERLPEGYSTMIGERGFSLSGGQRQRIAIARAILADPRVLVLDDATSAVDPSKEHEIREAMRTVMDGRTTFVIAHRPGTIALADTVVLLDGGKVAATGTHEELIASEPRYRQVLAAMEADEADREAKADEADREAEADSGSVGVAGS